MSEMFFAGEKAQKNFVFDLKNWTMADFEAFGKAFAEKDYAKQAELYSRIVVEWPFEVDPRDPQSWEKLNLVDMASTIRAVRKAVENLFAEGN